MRNNSLDNMQVIHQNLRWIFQIRRKSLTRIIYHNKLTIQPTTLIIRIMSDISPRQSLLKYSRLPSIQPYKKFLFIIFIQIYPQPIIWVACKNIDIYNQSHMSRTQQENYDLIISALRANRLCIKERQELSLIRSTVTGQIEPSVAKKSAVSLINCYNRVNDPNRHQNQRKQAINSLMAGKYSEQAVNAYVNAE